MQSLYSISSSICFPFLLGCSQRARKPENPGFVKTPVRQSRRSVTSTQSPEPCIKAEPTDDTMGGTVLKKRKPTNNVNGNGIGSVKVVTGNGAYANGNPKDQDHKVDNSGEFEFGGVWGTGFVMVFFPILMWYLWVGQAYYNAQLPLPKSGETIGEFVKNLYRMAYEVLLLTSALYNMDLANQLRSLHFLVSKLGLFTGSSLSIKVFSTSPFQVFGLRATLLPTGITSASIITAMPYGHSTSLSPP